MVYGRKLTKQGIFSPVNDSIWVNITLFIFDDLFYSRAKKTPLEQTRGVKGGEEKNEVHFPFYITTCVPTSSQKTILLYSR